VNETEEQKCVCLEMSGILLMNGFGKASRDLAFLGIGCNGFSAPMAFGSYSRLTALFPSMKKKEFFHFQWPTHCPIQTLNVSVGCYAQCPLGYHGHGDGDPNT
jgi:hypothetical protein